MQLSIEEVNYLAATGIGLQYQANDYSSTAVNLASNFLHVLDGNNSSYPLTRSEILAVFERATGNSSASYAKEILSNFQWLPHDAQPGYAAVWILMVVISGIAVSLRLFSRLRYYSGLKVEDWVLLFAWILATANNIEDLVAFLFHNWSRHCWDMNLFDINFHYKVAAADFFIGSTAAVLFKVALLFVYHDLYPSRLFRASTYALAVVVFSYWVFIIAFLAVRCRPFDTWNHPTTYKCLSNDLQIFYAVTAINIPIDILIVLPPIVVVRKLHLPRAEKLGVMAVIGVGALVCIASIVRLTTLRDYTGSQDVSRRALRVTTWQLMETHLGIVCASIPAMRKLVQAAMGAELSTNASSHRGSQRGVNMRRDRSWKSTVTAATVDEVPDGSKSPHDLASETKWNVEIPYIRTVSSFSMKVIKNGPIQEAPGNEITAGGAQSNNNIHETV